MEEMNVEQPRNGMNMMLVVGVLLVVVLLGGGIYYYVNNAKNSSQRESNQAIEPTLVAPTLVPSRAISPDEVAPTGIIVDVTVKGSNFAFSPKVIYAEKGDTVRVKFENTGGMHDFVIDEFNVKTKTIKDGESDTVEFIVDKTGTFSFYCSVGKHREMGMEGQLIVE